jgi:ABC-type phosphate transport system substrate-binding protein
MLRRATAAGGEVDVIVNKANTVDDLPVADAKKVFMGDKTTWPSGKRVTILMLAPGQPERADVLRQIYKMSEDDYGQYFTASAFAGKIAAPPKDISSAAQMKQAVAANAGAIGYVKKEDVDDTVKTVLKLQ